MSTRVFCDGCDVQLRPPGTRYDGEHALPAITGERTDGFDGGGLPSGRFHWCQACARVAFDALAQYRRVALDGGTVRR